MCENYINFVTSCGEPRLQGSGVSVWQSSSLTTNTRFLLPPDDKIIILCTYPVIVLTLYLVQLGLRETHCPR